MFDGNVGFCCGIGFFFNPVLMADFAKFGKGEILEGIETLKLYHRERERERERER